MGKPFNFFGYQSPAFILNGAFLFDDITDYNFYFSGYFSGIPLDNTTLSIVNSGQYTRDIDPEIYTLNFTPSADFENPSIDLTNFDFNITGELADAVHIDRTDLGINFYAEYVEEPVYKFSLLNNINKIETKGISKDETSLSNNVNKVKLFGGDMTETASLSNSVPEATMQGEVDLADNYDLNFIWNGSYQKNPD
ncbi:MAG: hypothetical protein QF380_06935 [Candidatus Marinimicrobia bacterium]|jgi:hypothetical protein|nr:hypothetical protein [Candidatus Neomarinimicrobiota bacterium]